MSPKKSLGKSPNEAPTSPPYFSCHFSSPVSRNNVNKPSLLSVPLGQNFAACKDIPLSLFNFHFPICPRPQHLPEQSPSYPQNSADFLNYSTSSIMERALQALQSKRTKRSNESLIDDVHTLAQASMKSFRSSDSPILCRSVTLLTHEEAIPPPKLRPSVSFTRPSSVKLPDHVSRLSSAALEAIAFGLKRPCPDDDASEEMSVSMRRSNDFSISDENIPLLSAFPAAKRRVTRDCETQTALLQVDSTTSTCGSSSLSLPYHQKRPSSSIRSTSVSRFIAGLEARARANILSRRLAASPATALTQAGSFKIRHAQIRQMFADLTEKSGVCRSEDLSASATESEIGAIGVTSINASVTSSPLFVSPLPNSAAIVSITATTEPEAAPSSVASTNTSVVEATAPMLTFSLEKASTLSKQEAVDTPHLIDSSLVFDFKVKSTTASKAITVPRFHFAMGSTPQKPTEQVSSSTIASDFVIPVSESASIFERTGLAATTLSTASSVSSAAPTPLLSSFTFPMTTTNTSAIAASSAPNFNFSTDSKSSAPLMSTATSFSTSAAKTTDPPSFDFPNYHKSLLSSTKPFDFSFTAVSTASDTTAVAIDRTFALAKTVENSSIIPSIASTALVAQSGFKFNSTVSTTASVSTTKTGPILNFLAKPSSITQTVSAIVTSAPTLSVFNFSAKSDTAKTSALFPAISTLTSAKPMPTFNFAPTTATGFNFFTNSTTAADATMEGRASCALTSMSPIAPSAFLMPAVSKGGATSSFNFPSLKRASTLPVITSNLPKTAAFGITNNSGPFSSTQFTFQSSTDSVAMPTTSSGFMLGPSTKITNVTSTSIAPFNFVNSVTNAIATEASGLKGLTFSAAEGSTLMSFDPKPVDNTFQFGDQYTKGPNTTTEAPSGFSLLLLPTKSSPSSATGHLKRTGEIAFGNSATTPFPFGEDKTKTFNLGGNLSPNPVSTGGSIGFNFSAAATNPCGNFNFEQTKHSTFAFSDSGTTIPNPFSATTPTAPNATASFQQRRRQMRFSKRR